MAFESKVKDPADVIDFTINWNGSTTPVLATLETISTSTWTLYDFPAGENPQSADFEWTEATDINIDSDTKTDTTTTVWVSEGARASAYLATNHITTNQGRAYDQTFVIKMKEK